MLFAFHLSFQDVYTEKQRDSLHISNELKNNNLSTRKLRIESNH